MDPLWQFKIHYLDLLDGVERGDGERAYRRLAADLRGLLVDSTQIVDAANRMFRLTVLFPVLPGVAEPEFVVHPGGASLNEALLAGPPDASKPTGSRTQYISRDDLLALPAVRLPDGSIFSIREAVLACANLGGAVHSSPRGAEGQRLLPLASALIGPGLSIGSALLIAVARHALAGYRHLFTLAEGASLGLAQPRSAHMPLLRLDPAWGQQRAAIEFAGGEFFEDGHPEGIRIPFVWIGTLALRVAGDDGAESGFPMADRNVFDVGPLHRPWPRFSLVQRGRSLVARLLAGVGEEVVTRPLRLMSRRFYAVATGITQDESGQRLRTFVRVRGSDVRTVEALGPSGLGLGEPTPSRMTLGSGLDRGEAKERRGALVQFTEGGTLRIASMSEIDAILEGMRNHFQSRRWVSGSLSDVRISRLYNQLRDQS